MIISACSALFQTPRVATSVSGAAKQLLGRGLSAVGFGLSNVQNLAMDESQIKTETTAQKCLRVAVTVAIVALASLITSHLLSTFVPSESIFGGALIQNHLAVASYLFLRAESKEGIKWASTGAFIVSSIALTVLLQNPILANCGALIVTRCVQELELRYGG